MALAKSLTATAVLALSVSAAAACDDYSEEMAMIAAKRAVAEAQAAAQQAAPEAQVVSQSQDPVAANAAEDVQATSRLAEATTR